MTARRITCICLTGPTAAGKTDIALELAQEFSAEIVSMDSAMVYRGMDIGTAKPDASTLARARHHLIDIRDPEDTYSAGQFAQDAARVIGDLHARGKLALVVGGTLLYLRALREGLASLPPRDEAVRKAIDAEAAEVGWAGMHERLAAIDPAAAARIRPSDPQRIQRALEVYSITGRPLSALQAAAEDPPPYDFRTFALVPADREILKARIEDRFDAMVERGFLDEVRTLRERPGLGPSSSSMRAVGYRQLWAYLEGEHDWQEARRRALAATRQLAKRQLTWLRADSVSEVVAADDPDLGGRLRAGIEGAIRR